MDQENKSSFLSDLLVTHSVGDHLHDSAKWCRFIGIAFASILGLYLLLFLVAGSVVAPLLATMLPELKGVGGNVLTGVLVTVVVIFLGLFGTLTVYLLRFALLTKKALEVRNQAMFNEGLRSLRIFFAIYGVIGILSLISNVFQVLKAL